MIARLLLMLMLVLAASARLDAQSAVDVPQLAGRGEWSVGVRRLTFPGPDPLAAGRPAHAEGRSSRALAMEVWYPTRPGRGAALPVRYVIPTPQTPTIDPATLPATVSFPGRATRDARAAVGERFPLILMSPGLNGRAAMFSDLAETMASKGYVVAAIDHEDPQGPVDRAFAAAAATRAADQRAALETLGALARADPLAGSMDLGRVALVGYSMGGFGALANAGAGYDREGALSRALPGEGLRPFADGAPAVEGPLANVRAIVAFAPWGGAPPLRAWSPVALGRVPIPALVVTGDADDVSGYRDGTRWLFDALTGSDRYLLVFRGARHNVVGNATPPAISRYFQFIERYEEPVWRHDRIAGIDAHFMTAFLDLHLKGRSDRAAFLNVPTPVAEDGVWPLGPGRDAGARHAGVDAESRNYWPGFQRRWAIGLELYHRPPSR